VLKVCNSVLKICLSWDWSTMRFDSNFESLGAEIQEVSITVKLKRDYL
jgi:hypothetical protein